MAFWVMIHEPAFHLIERMSRSYACDEKSQYPGRFANHALTQPMFAAGVVIDDEMDVEVRAGCSRPSTMTQRDDDELLVTMARFGLSDDLSGGNVEIGKQGASAMPPRRNRE